MNLHKGIENILQLVVWLDWWYNDIRKIFKFKIKQNKCLFRSKKSSSGNPKYEAFITGETWGSFVRAIKLD